MADSNLIHSMTVELLNAYEELSLLYALTADIGQLTSEEAIMRVALTEALQVISADQGFVVSWCGGRPSILMRVGATRECVDLDEIGRLVLAPRRARSRSNILVNDTAGECGENSPRCRLLACSLSSGPVPEAYLCLLRPFREPIFTSADQKLIAAVSVVAAIGIDNLWLHRSEVERLRLEHELDMAQKIQQSLLPTEFSCPCYLEAAGESQPCYQIGGDYYDLVPLSEHRCLSIIADVSGKGPAAALKAATVQGNVQALSRTAVDLPTFMLALNDCFRSRSADSCNFVTAFVGVFDRSGVLHYSNAGHCAPLLVERSGTVSELREGGPLLGFFDRPRFEEASVRLLPGDLLVLYTDGVTECEDEHGGFFGSERLMSWAITHAGKPPDQLRRTLMETIRQFCGQRAQTDDLTFLMLRYKGDV